MSALARVEVPAALWRKRRVRELSAQQAGHLVREFEADLLGTPSEPPRFAVVRPTSAVLDAAAQLVAAHGLRAYDGVQLASALAAEDSHFACFDSDLRVAAAAEGFELVP